MTRTRLRGARGISALLATMLVVMLLLAGLSYVLLDIGGPAPQDDDGDGDGQPPPDGVRTIDGDTTWRSVNASLGGPVLVRDGASLALEGCNITVDLEDLVLWGTPAFEVEHGCELVLLRSRLTVRMDQDPSTVYISSDPWSRWDAPIASRIVNLVHARHPVLAFNVSLRRVSTDVLVLGQRTAQDPMRLLARLPAREGVWERMEVDLSSISGGVGRVAIAPLDLTMGEAGTGTGVILLADARVLDDGAVPYGDVFDTGDLELDGWSLRGYARFHATSSGSFIPTVPALVHAEGEVRVIDSTLDAPIGVPRRVDALDGEISWNTRQSMQDSSFDHARIGAHVEVVQGGLEVAGSRLLNVPVRADASWATVNSSRLDGDAELLTLRGCTGGASSSAFIRRPSGPLPYAGGEPSDFRKWAVSVEDGGPVWFRDCDIDGGGLCLYLENVSAVADGCALANATEACLWAHDASGLGGWPQLNRTCTFAPAEREDPWDDKYDYIESSTCVIRGVFHNGTDDLEPELSGYIPYGTQLYSLPLLHEMGNGLQLSMPSLLVRDDLSQVLVPNVTLRVWCSPSGSSWTIDISRTQVIEQGTRELVMHYDQGDVARATDPAYILDSMGILHPNLLPGTMAGEVLLNITVYRHAIDELDIMDPFIRVWLDGRSIDELPLDPEESFTDRYTYVCATLAVPAGRHSIKLQLLGSQWGHLLQRAMVNETVEVLRVNGSTPSADVRDGLDYGTWLLVDPGTDLVVVDPPTWGTEDYFTSLWLEALLWPGSNLTVRDLEPEDDFLLDAYVNAIGEGTLTLAGWEAAYLSLHTQGVRVRLSDLAIYQLAAYVHDRPMQMERCTFSEGMYLAVMGTADVTADACTFRASDRVSSVLNMQATTLNLALRNCTLTAEAAHRAVLRSVMAGSVVMDGCTVRNVTLMVIPPSWPLESNMTLDLQGCVFTGELAFLMAGAVGNGTSSPPGMLLGINGTTFAGEGTGAVLARGLLPSFPRDALLPGAALLAFRPLDVGSPGGRGDYHDLIGLDAESPFEGIIDLSDFGIYDQDNLQLLFDLVEGEADFGYDGRPMTIVMRSWQEVVGFLETPIEGYRIEVQVQDWSDIESTVTDYRRQFLGDLDWWSTGG